MHQRYSVITSHAEWNVQQSMGFISHIDLEKNQWKMFGKVIDSGGDWSDLLSVTVEGLQLSGLH